ncbi:MAG: hypothetical protein HOP33_15420 [Verrucomicrobia bacterium]|nr:hypothetical protein [Verrucomicrobiota bacterium]
MMNSDERDIFYYLKGCKGQFVSSHEICRRAGGKKRFQREPDWAKPILVRMADRGIIETDPAGYSRIKPQPKRKEGDTQCWVSPQMAHILKSSGKDFSEAIKIDGDEDGYYDSL